MKRIEKLIDVALAVYVAANRAGSTLDTEQAAVVASNLVAQCEREQLGRRPVQSVSVSDRLLWREE